MGSQLQKPPHYEHHDFIEHAPLAEALCQISYPPILKINEGIDSNIQDRLAGWPEYEQVMEPIFIENDNNSPTAQFIPNHKFANSETMERVSVRNHSLSFATNNYLGWDDFLNKLTIAYAAFRSCYTPSAITRIGLRYTNFISCDLFSAETGKNISDYINEQFSGPIAGFIKSDSFIRSYRGELIINNDGKTSTHIGYGLVTRMFDNSDAFLIDIDVFCDHKQPLDIVFPDLSVFHEYAYDAFRWVVKNVPDNNH